ncbi:hypothetical protein Agub_g2855, partial [Astrephomene gubernaculifera]
CKAKTWTGRVAETWELLPEYPVQLLLPPLQPEPAVLQQQLPDQQQQAPSPQAGESYLAPLREAVTGGDTAAAGPQPQIPPQYMHYYRQQMRAVTTAVRSPLRLSPRTSLVRGSAVAAAAAATGAAAGSGAAALPGMNLPVSLTLAPIELDVDYETEVEPFLGRLIGVGGFGRVYEATFRGRKVAVKTVVIEDE